MGRPEGIQGDSLQKNVFMGGGGGDQSNTEQKVKYWIFGKNIHRSVRGRGGWGRIGVHINDWSGPAPSAGSGAYEEW